MEAPLVIRVLAASVCLAEKASSLIRTVYASKDLAIIDKGVNDFQSRADRDSQRCIVQSLNNTFPGLHIIGEEGELDAGNVPQYSELSPEVLQHKCPPWLSTLSTDDLVVWVDPLDGTKEFTEGLVEYVTVLIGIAAGGKPVGGVVAQPFYQPTSVEDTKKPHYITRVVWGLSDVGVFGVKPSLPSSQLPYPIDLNAPKLSLPHSIVVTRSHRSPTHDTVIKAFYPTESVCAGGCGYKVLMLLEGRGHVYVFPSQGTKKWDTCAPEAVLLASGGKLTDILGQPYNYSLNTEHENVRGILATPVADWLPAYISCLPKEVVDDFSSRK